MEEMTVIQDSLLVEIRKDLRTHHPDIFHEALTDQETKEVLRSLIANEHQDILDTEEKVNYVMQELIDLSFIERLKEDEHVTDIGFNGKELILQGNGMEKRIVDEFGDITPERMMRLVAKFSNLTDKEISPKNPILNSSMRNMRINAVHKTNSPYGMTTAFRISRPTMRIREDNFESSGFAPAYILELLKALVKTRSNVVIAGETGTGKTEFQKFILSLIPFNDRVIAIEQVMELYLHDLFPKGKDFWNWVASETTSIEDLIRAALRSHPNWIVVGESLGQEAYEMMQAVLSGHHIVTTLHAVDARAIPQRILNMAKMGYKIDEKAFLDNIYRYFQFGFYTKIRRGVRYLSEIVEFHSDHTATTVFEQVVTPSGLESRTGELSDEFMKRLIEFDSDYKGFGR